MQSNSNSTQNLNQCLEMQKFDTSPKSRYNKAKELRLNGLFPEAGYEFNQALADTTLRKVLMKQIADVMKVLVMTRKVQSIMKKRLQLAMMIRFKAEVRKSIG